MAQSIVTVSYNERDPLKQNHAIRELAQRASGLRRMLTAAETFNVATTGNDTSGDGSSAKPFLTIQAAYDAIVANLDLGGQTATIQIADATYTAGCAFSQPWSGGGSVVVQGNSSTPANVLISTTSAHCFNVTCTLPGILLIKNLKVTSVTTGNGIRHFGVGAVNFSNVVFGALANNCISGSNPGAQIIQTGNCSVVGNVQTYASAQNGAYIEFIAFTITLTGTPAFATAFVFSSNIAAVVSVACTFSGSGTGTRYQVQQNASVDTAGGGATYFPGNVGGTTATGGIYV